MRGEEENEEGGKEKEGEEEDTCQSSQPGGLHVVKLNSSTTHPPRASHAQCKGLLRNSHVHEYQGGSSQTYVSGVKYQVSSIRCQVSSVRCQVSGVRCQVSSVRCQVSGIKNIEYITFELYCYWIFPITSRES